MAEYSVRHQCGSCCEKSSISGKSCREKETKEGGGRKEGNVCVCGGEMQLRRHLSWTDLGACPLLHSTSDLTPVGALAGVHAAWPFPRSSWAAAFCIPIT